MDERGIDAGVSHLLQGVVFGVGGNLPMMPAHLRVLPDMDLGIDDQHAGSSL